MFNNFIRLLIIIPIAIIFLSTSFTQQTIDYNTDIELSNIDYSVNPTEDFYQYAVGNWIKNNPIPGDQVIWGAFRILREKRNEQVKTIIDEAVERYKSGAKGITEQIGKFYLEGMDTVKIENLGFTPIAEDLKCIDQITDRKQLKKVIAYMHKHTSNPLFNFIATVDSKNSDSVIAGIQQGGLGLPDRDYYINNDPQSKEMRSKYVEHLTKMLSLIGSKDSKSEAERVLNFETRLAKASNTNVENRDPIATYNKLTTEEIISLAPGFDWKLYFNEIELGDAGKVDVAQPKFIKEIAAMVEEVSIEDWKLYLKWNLLTSMADYLSSDFVNENFQFFDKFLNGRQVIQPRWKRVLSITSFVLGEAIGQLYVQKYFPPEAKARAIKIVESLKVSMKESINNLEWMSKETKEEALIKLSRFKVKLGYPDMWKDYSGLEITDESYVENIKNAIYFNHVEKISKINKPVREWEWFTTPQTVNAFYDPTKNEIVFPAAILQPPFYDVNADDAVNYGAMGAVIGHEITHGFDDSGRQYDADGNLRDWWTEEDNEKFNQRAKVIIDQFNEFEPIDSFFVNGELTQGENIADLGGLTISFNAFRKTEQFRNGKKIDGFTPAQRFFLSWAQVWKTSIRQETLKILLKTDPHSPANYRVNGPLSNMTEFYEAFNVKESDRMYRNKDQRVKIW